MENGYRLSDFTLVRKLGKGGFGSAYLVHRISDGAELCLKRIPMNTGAQIEREAKMLSELNSQYIIKYHGSFVESGYFYILMEYAAEGSLADLINVCFRATVDTIDMFMELFVRIV